MLKNISYIKMSSGLLNTAKRTENTKTLFKFAIANKFSNISKRAIELEKNGKIDQSLKHKDFVRWRILTK